MIKNISLALAPADAADAGSIKRMAALELDIPAKRITGYHIFKRSIDARAKQARVVLQLEVFIDEQVTEKPAFDPQLNDVTHAPHIVIVGAGPAGLFAALRAIALGYKPVVLERGKDVRSRRRDLAAMNKEGIVNPESNYCFGEGGAGTYSDGKLYTRATKRGDIHDVLGTLALHGAPRAILEDARPHIGSNKLPKVVTALRERLEGCGVGFRFGAKVTGLLVDERATPRRITGVRLASGEELCGRAVVLATGHSARSVWQMLRDVGARLEPKPFALGVRIEHPQPLINELQYGRAAGHPKLPNASYRVVENVDGRGVFSFCMCPGGFIVPASTEAGGLVVNGMSLSRRDSPFANSGLVVSVEPADAAALFGEHAFAGVELQRAVEQAACAAGGGGLVAPATRVTDFLASRSSSTTPRTSYQPGLAASDVAAVLDASGHVLSTRLRAALVAFGKRMPRYLSEEAVLIGVESRTSAPVRVARDKETRMAPGLDALYPCGEGAGYAGGIVSAALDGMATARAIIQQQR